MEDISQSVLTIVSYLETLVQGSDIQTAAYRTKEMFKQLGITEKDKKALVKVLKAIIIMTNGSVKTIRNPERFESKSATTFRRLAGDKMAMIFDAIGETSTADSKITQQDYELTKSIVAWAGGKIITADDITALKKNQNLHWPHQTPRTVNTKLYRGLSDLTPKSFLFFLKPGASMDISEGVSTSIKKSTAEDFAQKGLKTMIEINNPERKGLKAGDLSVWIEQEVILSGILKINDWYLQPLIGHFYDENNSSQKCSILISKDLIKIKPYHGWSGSVPTFEMDSFEFLEKLFDMVKNSAYEEKFADANGRTIHLVPLVSVLNLKAYIFATV